MFTTSVAGCCYEARSVHEAVWSHSVTHTLGTKPYCNNTYNILSACVRNRVFSNTMPMNKTSGILNSPMRHTKGSDTPNVVLFVVETEAGAVQRACRTPQYGTTSASTPRRLQYLRRQREMPSGLKLLKSQHADCHNGLLS